MALKVGNKYIGESPEEQIKLERKRFKARQERLVLDQQIKRSQMLKADDGKNQKLFQ